MFNFILLLIYTFSFSNDCHKCINESKFNYHYFYGNSHDVENWTHIKLSIYSKYENEIRIRIPMMEIDKTIILNENKLHFENLEIIWWQLLKYNNWSSFFDLTNGKITLSNIAKHGITIDTKYPVFVNINDVFQNSDHATDYLCYFHDSFNLLEKRNYGRNYRINSSGKTKFFWTGILLYSTCDSNKISYTTHSRNNRYKGYFYLNKGENSVLPIHRLSDFEHSAIEFNSEFPISIIQTSFYPTDISNKMHYQTLYPNKFLGKEYLLTSFDLLNGQKKSYDYRIVPLEDETEITINGDNIGTYSKDDFFDGESDNITHIKANKKISISQYTKKEYALVLELPINQMSKQLEFIASTPVGLRACNGIIESIKDSLYCNIVGYKNDEIYLNGELLDNFENIPDTDFKQKTLLIDPGFYSIKSEKGVKAKVFGYVQGRSSFYAYNAGGAFDRDDADILINNKLNVEILCYDSPLIVTADAPGKTESFHWTINDTLQAEGKEVELNLPKSGEYNIKLKLDNDDEQVYEWTVTRLEKITTDLDSVIFLCNDSLNSIEMNVSGGGTSKSITWFPSENIQNPNDFNIQFIKPISETQTFYYEITDEHCCTYNDSVIIEIQKVNPIISATQNNFCVGDSATLSLDKDYETILWNTGEATQDILVKESGTYSATVTEGNCTNDASIVINVNPLPVINIETPNGTLLCDGGSIEVVIETNNKTEVIWNDNSRLKIRLLNEAGTYTVKARDIETNCEITEKVIIYDMDDVEANIIGNTTFCDGESTTLTIKPSGDSYLWNTGETTQSIIVNESGVYSATVTTEAGCEVDAEIEVEKLPLPEFEILGDKIICNNEIEIYPDKDFVSYEWTFGSDIISTERVLIIDKAGDYTLTVTDDNGCKTTEEVEITEATPDIDLNENDINFGEILFGQISSQIITSDRPITIIRNTTLFNVSINNTQINITFNPENIGIYEDYIVVESIGDCKASATITIVGICKAEILASVSNSEGYPGDFVSNQLSLELQQQIPLPIDFEYDITLSINQDAITISNPTTFNYANGKLLIDIDNLITQQLLTEPIEKIESKILLAKNRENPLEITNFTTDHNYLIPLRRDGNISIYEICLYEERLIEHYNAAIIQKISKTQATLSTYHSGKYEIEIADISGKTITKISETTEKDQTINFNYNLSNGTYIFKITEPGKMQTRKIMFVE